MALNFPTAPTPGLTYEAEGVSYEYVDGRWRVVGLSDDLYLPLAGGTLTGPTVFQGGENAQADTSAAGVVIDNFTPAMWLMDRSSDAYGYMLQANANIFLLYQTARDGGGGVEVLRSTPGSLVMNNNRDVNWPGIVVRSGTTNGSSFSVGPSASSADNWTLSYRGQNNADEFWIMWENSRKLGLRPDGIVYIGDVPVSSLTTRSGISLLPNGSLNMQREAADTNPNGARIGYFWGDVYSLKMSTNGNIQNANNSYGSLSDARMKKDIVDLSPQLADLMKLRPVSYVKTDDPEQKKQAGLIAQEVLEVKPGLVEEPDPETGMLSVKYSVLVPLLLKALQELAAEVAEIKGAA